MTARPLDYRVEYGGGPREAATVLVRQETHGVAVVTLGADEFPAFFTPSSGLQARPPSVALPAL